MLFALAWSPKIFLTTGTDYGAKSWIASDMTHLLPDMFQEKLALLQPSSLKKRARKASWVWPVTTSGLVLSSNLFLPCQNSGYSNNLSNFSHPFTNSPLPLLTTRKLPRRSYGEEGLSRNQTVETAICLPNVAVSQKLFHDIPASLTKYICAIGPFQHNLTCITVFTFSHRSSLGQLSSHVLFPKSSFWRMVTMPGQVRVKLLLVAHPVSAESCCSIGVKWWVEFWVPGILIGLCTRHRHGFWRCYYSLILSIQLKLADI